MTLLGKLRLSEETRLRFLEGEPDEVQARLRAIHDAKLRPARPSPSGSLFSLRGSFVALEWHEPEADNA
jgi:hypothetical protein